MGDALARIAHLHLQQNEAEAAAAQPGPGISFAENMAQGASMGLGSTIGGQETQDFLSQARSANPKASLAGTLVGGAIPAALLGGMPAFAGAPATAAAVPAGLQTGLETGSPAAGALAAGGTLVGGKILGAVGGKLGLGKVAGNIASALGQQGAAEGGELIGGMPEAQLRNALVKQGFTDEALDRAVAAAKAKMTPQVRTQAGGVTTELPTEKLSPIAGTEGRGFEVTRERAI